MSRFIPKRQTTVLAYTLPVASHLQRFDGGAEREVGQRDGQTEEDEQEEHRGGAQSASADVNQQ